jgi:hypothetical protein
LLRIHPGDEGADDGEVTACGAGAGRNNSDGQITTDTELVSIKPDATGPFTLTFKNGSGTKSVTADHVLLAPPFSILRDVDYRRAGFEPRKLTAIEELGMGTNSKLHVGSPESRRSGKATATSAASTRRRTSRATCREPSRRASVPPARSWAT